MERNRNCFVISPIGTENSETKRLADDFLELLIEPALEPFNFNIIRSDKITESSIITSDIIKHVQSADLCIIDLTGSNPNVFYECGRRHENGRPFIQLIKKGEKLPFDVSNIRTIYYDVSNPRSTLETVRSIQNFVKKINENDFEAASKGDSLTSLSEGIARIERTINSIASEFVYTRYSNLQPNTNLTNDLLKKHPIIVFNESFDKGKLDVALTILPRIKKLIGFKDWFLSACKIVETGEPGTDSIIKDSIIDKNNITEDLILQGFSALYNYYYNRNASLEGSTDLLELYKNLTVNVSDKTKAMLINYISVLFAQCKKFEEAIRYGLEILELDMNGIYLMNLAQSYIEINRLEEAAIYLSQYLNQSDVNNEGLKTALNVFTTLGRTNDIKKVEEILNNS